MPLSSTNPQNRIRPKPTSLTVTLVQQPTILVVQVEIKVCAFVTTRHANLFRQIVPLTADEINWALSRPVIRSADFRKYRPQSHK